MSSDATLVTDEVRALARPEVVDLTPYDPWFDIVSVEATEPMLELSSNENPFGPSPEVARVLAGLAPQIGRYPDPACRRLRAALADHTGVAADHIAIGNGAENLIELVCQAFLSPGDRVLTQTPCYALHDIHPRAMGAVVDKVAMGPDLGFDVPAWRAALAQPTKLVMFSNPSNPVGCVLDHAGFCEIVAATPRGALLVVDEAYGEYAVEHHPSYPESLPVLRAQQRPWLILRTFSKAYGLAGLRVGYALASDARIVSWLNRVRSPYNVNHAAQETALAALADPAHMRDGVKKVGELRRALAARLRAHGYTVAPSYACFLYVDVGASGVEIAERLKRRGIAVKPWREQGYTSFIRVTIGQQEENERFFAALLEVSARRPAREVHHGHA
jgi:histidinol-phosphate aminotransferase